MQNSENVLLKIQRLKPYLNPALKKIATYILSHYNEVKLQTINELAEDCSVSESTVTRFVKEIGFNNYQKLKIAIAEISSANIQDVINEKKIVHHDIKKIDSVETIIKKIAFKNIEALEETSKLINPSEINKAVSAIEKAAVIAVYGSASSAVVGQNAALRFLRLGKQCTLYDDPLKQYVTSSLLNKSDVAIGISSSGKTRFTVNSLRNAKKAGATTICITDSKASQLVKNSDIKFFTSAIYSDFLQDSMLSRMAQFLVIDILYSSYAIKHYDKSLKLIKISADAIKEAKKM